MKRKSEMTNKTTKRGPGRPSRYSPQLGLRIANEIATGSNLRKIALSSEMPALSTILKWLSEKSEFSDQYARARETRADSRSDQIDAIVDAMVTGKLDPQSARVAIDAFKWLAAKECPKRYGDKMQTEISGPGGRPIESEASSRRDAIRSAEHVVALVAELRAAVSDPAERSRLLGTLPPETADLARRLDEGQEFADRVRPPACFRGIGSED